MDRDIWSGEGELSFFLKLQSDRTRHKRSQSELCWSQYIGDTYITDPTVTVRREGETEKRERERNWKEGYNGETGMREIGWRERKREQREIDW